MQRRYKGKDVIQMVTVLIILSLLLGYSLAEAEMSQEPQNFNVQFTLNYNVATLAEAAALEKGIREQHANACWLKTKVTPVPDLTSSNTGAVYFNTGETFRIE